MNSNDFQSNVPDNNKIAFDSYSNMNGNKKNNNLVVILFFLILKPEQKIICIYKS